MRRKTGPFLRPACSNHPFKASTGRPIRNTWSSSSFVVVLVRPRRIDRQGRGARICRIGLHGIPICQVLDTKRGHFRPATAAGGESGQKQCPIAQIDGALAGCRPAAALPGYRRSPLVCSCVDAAERWLRTANRGADLSEEPSKAPVRPRQRVRIDQLVNRRRTVSGACGPSALNRGWERKPTSTSAGMPWLGSSAHLSGSQRWWATNLSSRLSGADQGRGLPVATSSSVNRAASWSRRSNGRMALSASSCSARCSIEPAVTSIDLRRPPPYLSRHGFMITKPTSSKSGTFRVASAAPRERAMAAIWASN